MGCKLLKSLTRPCYSTRSSRLMLAYSVKHKQKRRRGRQVYRSTGLHTVCKNQRCRQRPRNQISGRCRSLYHEPQIVRLCSFSEPIFLASSYKQIIRLQIVLNPAADYHCFCRNESLGAANLFKSVFSSKHMAAFQMSFLNGRHIVQS